jgi:hypothetical protein
MGFIEVSQRTAFGGEPAFGFRQRDLGLCGAGRQVFAARLGHLGALDRREGGLLGPMSALTRSACSRRRCGISFSMT